MTWQVTPRLSLARARLKEEEKKKRWGLVTDGRLFQSSWIYYVSRPPLLTGNVVVVRMEKKRAVQGLGNCITFNVTLSNDRRRVIIIITSPPLSSSATADGCNNNPKRRPRRCCCCLLLQQTARHSLETLEKREDGCRWRFFSSSF